MNSSNNTSMYFELDFGRSSAKSCCFFFSNGSSQVLSDMEKSYSSITSRASHELNHAKDLICALPVLDKIENEIKHGWIPQEYKNLVSKLQSYELNDKMKDVSANILVEILELLLKDDHSFFSTIQTISSNDIYIKFEEYLNHVMTISEDFLNTTVVKSEINNINTFKLIDRYERLQEERDKLASGLAEREEKVNDELSLEQGKLDRISREIDHEKDRLQMRESDLDRELQSTLQSMRLDHDRVMKTLQNELEELQETLRENSFQHAEEKQRKEREIKSYQNDLEHISRRHEETKDALENQINMISITIPDISMELEELTHKLYLLQKNDEIEQEEKRLLQKIIDLEEKATGILDHAASQIQRIFRGIQGRSHVQKLKKKSKMKKKKSKK